MPKVCIKCKERKEDFRPASNICKECARKKSKEYYWAKKAEGYKAPYKLKPKKLIPPMIERMGELRKVKRELGQCKTREERQIFLRMMFERIRNDVGLWQYITRFGDDHVPVTNQGLRKNKKQIKNEDI